MKLTVLTDNHTFIDQYYLGEPALCFLIETDGRKLLLDTGYSNVCLRNSQAMGIDLAQVDTIVLSHGHNDHTGGLVPLRDAGLLAGKTVLAHPSASSPNGWMVRTSAVRSLQGNWRSPAIFTCPRNRWN